MAKTARAATKKATAKKASARASAKEASTAGKASTKKKSAAKASVTQAAKKTSTKKTAAKKKASAKKASATQAAKKTSTKKTGTKKATAKKSGTKKASAKKTAQAAKKATAKKSGTKKAAKDSGEQLSLVMEVTSPAANDGPALRDGPLQPGDSIPDFSLPADDGTTYSRQSLAGQRFVIYFYPRDNTPGCTQEACDFRDRQPQLDAAGTLVLGVSGDSIKSHAGFRAKHGLGFPLLADTDRSVAAAFGALGEKSMYGRKSIGIIRSTFVVGPDGVVLHTFAPVRVKGHADAVLQALGEG